MEQAHIKPYAIAACTAARLLLHRCGSYHQRIGSLQEQRYLQQYSTEAITAHHCSNQHGTSLKDCSMMADTTDPAKPAAKPRRRLGPTRAHKKPDGWEDIQEGDLLTLPTGAGGGGAEEEPEEPPDDLWRCEPWDEDEVPCLLVTKDAWATAKAKRPLASCDDIEALCASVRPCPCVVKVPRAMLDEATRRALEDDLVLASYADEVDGFSSRQLLLSVATPSKREVVRDLKALLLGCARDPRWLAAMAAELDKLSDGCDRRSNALIRLKDARRAFNERKALALPQIEDPAQQMIVNEVTRRIEQIEGLINDLEDHEPAPAPPVENGDASEAPTDDDEGAEGDDEREPRPPPAPEPEATPGVPPEVERAPSPPVDEDAALPVAAAAAADLHAAALASAPALAPREPPSALLDAILAMILLRIPPRPGVDGEQHIRWIQQKHAAFVQIWRDELGVLPRSSDATDPSEVAAAS